MPLDINLLPDKPKLDLSRLPDQPRKALDISMLPDKPQRIDVSLLPDKTSPFAKAKEAFTETGRVLASGFKIPEQVSHEVGAEEVRKLTGRQLKPRTVVSDLEGYRFAAGSIREDLMKEVSPRVRRAKEKQLAKIEETLRRGEEQQREIETLTPEEKRSYEYGTKLGQQRTREIGLIKVAIFATYLGSSAISAAKKLPANLRYNKSIDNLLKRIETLTKRRQYPSLPEIQR